MSVYIQDDETQIIQNENQIRKDKKKKKRKKDDCEQDTTADNQSLTLEKKQKDAETDTHESKKKKKKKQKDVSAGNEDILSKSKDSTKEITSSTTSSSVKDGQLIDDENSKQDVLTLKKNKKSKKKNKQSVDELSSVQGVGEPVSHNQAAGYNDAPSSPLKISKSIVEPANPSKSIPDQDTSNSLPQAAQQKVSKKSKKDKKGSKANGASDDLQPKFDVRTSGISPASHSITPEELQQFISSNRISYEPPTVVEEFPPVLKFEDVQVHESLRKAFSTFQKPSPIQSAVWPVLMAGRDVVGIAETGSGKTLAFGVPALQHILDSGHTGKSASTVNVLVIAPTRELAMQTESTLCGLGKLMSPQIKTLCLYGGVSKHEQKNALSTTAVRVVAGTPGRLLDLANEGYLKLDQVGWLILDEADRMLDKGFENDIRAIINLCRPSRSGDMKSRLTTMFSATWPTSVRRLAADFMHDPVRILVGADELTASCSVEQTVEVLEESRGKEWKLLSTLKQLNNENQKNKSNGSPKDKIIVFALYKKEAQRLHEFLLGKGFRACCIEGNMSQDKRSKSLEDFMTGKATILVATDVAARGLDIPKVEFVINVTFPLTIEDYIHRIGRTGRAGRTGKSITFFTDQDKSHAGELIRVLKDAGQAVPEALKQWGGQIKKKTHAAYGDHWKDIDPTVKAKKITFD